MRVDRPGAANRLPFSGDNTVAPRSASDDAAASAPSTESEAAVSAARTIAYSFLARRDYAEAELRQRLLRRGVAPAVAERVLTELSAAGYVDDSRFAAAWVAARGTGKGLGRRRLRQELRQKGIDPETGDAALASYDAETELETAIEAAARRARQYPPATSAAEAARQRHRLAQFLQRRGFDWETTKAAVNRVLPCEE